MWVADMLGKHRRYSDPKTLDRVQYREYQDTYCRFRSGVSPSIELDY